MQGIAPVVLFVLAFALAGLAGAAPALAVETEIRVVTVDAAKAGRAKGPGQGGSNDKTALWWNDPKVVKAVSLTDEQRNKMDGYLKAFRKKVPENRRPETFHETLVQGDWKKARREGAKLAKGAETSIRMRGTLKVDVLSRLSEEQLKILVDQFPRLIYKPWRNAMGGASPR